jgi:hypothetical protein
MPVSTIGGPTDYGLAVPFGQVPGQIGVNKFGRNPDIDTVTAPEDVWDGGGIWVAPQAARVHDLASSSALDAAAGTGARTVRVFGLTGWGAPEVSEVVALNGVGLVPTVNAYVIVHRIEALTWGNVGPATGANAGTITATAQVDGTVTAQINVGVNQTLMAIFGLPSGRTLFLTQWYMGLNRPQSGGSADMELRINSTPDVAEGGGYMAKSHVGLSNPGSSFVQRRFGPYVPVPGPAIIKVRCDLVTANNTDVSGGFDGILA